MAHPLRHQILIFLDEREASPKELSELLDEDLWRICYHVTRLKELRCIELVGTDTRRGGRQHFYKAVVRPILDTIDDQQMPQVLREEGSSSILSLVWKDVNDSVKAGVFDSKPARTLLRMGIVVDDQGFEESGEAAMRYLRELSEIEGRSTGRLAEAGQTGFKANTATFVFPKAPVAARRA